MLLKIEVLIKNGHPREAALGTKHRQRQTKATINTTQTTETMMSKVDTIRKLGSGHGCFWKGKHFVFLVGHPRCYS